MNQVNPAMEWVRLCENAKELGAFSQINLLPIFFAVVTYDIFVRMRLPARVPYEHTVTLSYRTVAGSAACHL